MADVFDPPRRPVLVLGASGFIGARLVAALDTHPRLRPIAASRHPKAGGIALNALEPAALRAALVDVDYVVNCIAGREDAMIKATEVLLESARPGAVRRIVHLSSMAVYGAATGLVREDQPPVTPYNGYAAAKIACDGLVSLYIGAGGDAVILRPTCVFGPGSAPWALRLARLLGSRRIGDLGSAGDGCCNLAYIDDVIATIIAAIETDAAAGRTFNVSSSAALTWNQFLIRFGRALGATPIRRIAPRTLKIEMKLLAPFRRLAAKRIAHAVTEAITPSLVALWAQDIHIDCQAAIDCLSMPQTPVDQMIAETVRWLQPATMSVGHEIMEPAGT